MPASMTGYGQGRAENDQWQVKIEIRTVNSRYLEVNVRLPRAFLGMENRIRQAVRRSISRGHVDVFGGIKALIEENCASQVDRGLAIAYYRALRELAQILDIPVNVGVSELAALPGVISAQEPGYDEAEVGPLVDTATTLALTEVNKVRTREGDNVSRDIRQRVGRLAQIVEGIEREAAGLRVQMKESLEQRLREIAGGMEIDPLRLAQEVLFYAERSDITEELVRLHSHLEQVEAAIEATGTVGKRLDFLMQELFRETNTIGTKGVGLCIANLVVAAKEEIEKMREQVQNIE